MHRHDVQVHIPKLLKCKLLNTHQRCLVVSGGTRVDWSHGTDAECLSVSRRAVVWGAEGCQLVTSWAGCQQMLQAAGCGTGRFNDGTFMGGGKRGLGMIRGDPNTKPALSNRSFHSAVNTTCFYSFLDWSWCMYEEVCLVVALFIFFVIAW